MVLLCHDHLFTPDDFATALAGGVTARVVQPFVDVEVWDGAEAFEATRHLEVGVARRALEAFDRVLSYVEDHPEQTLLLRTSADLDPAKQSGRAGVILGSEGGRILDEEALCAALREGRLRGAAIDVATEEPVPPASPLWQVPNLVLTPHVSTIQEPDGWWDLVSGLMSENLARYATGRELLNVVDPSAGY